MKSGRPVILGIGGILNHDGNAALLVDDRIVAASQEERFTRIKHDAEFPRSAIMDCLELAGLRPEDVDVCVFAEKPLQSLIHDRTGRPSNGFTRTLSRIIGAGRFGYPAAARKLFPDATFGYAWHHMSHAAAAFATSPFERAAFLCVDGKGEDLNATIGVVDARSIEVRYELENEYGIGLLYTLVTCFLGFDTYGSEYKVMGLAPYGTPRYADRIREFAESDGDGAFRLRRRVTFTWSVMDAAIDEFAAHIGLARRQKGGVLSEEYIDVAASIQHIFEQELVAMARFARRATGEENLLFCGGCAQNCVTAGKLRRLGIFSGVFNSPVGGDMGTGVGAALLWRYGARQPVNKVDTRGYYLGSEPGAIPNEANGFRVPYEGNIHEATARLLAQGRVVGWVRGRMELGARALGARSILADPRVANMQSMLNLKVKFRESFRPFAPAILGEDCSAWFDTAEASDYMQYTAYLLPEHRYPIPDGLRGLRERLDFRRCSVPSVVHVDYSARIQTVRREVHPDFHQLLSEFKRITGVPMVINTSFNVSGQPIVRTGEEAWQCFQHTDMDFLVINDTILSNPNDKTREEKISWSKRFENYS